MKEVVRRFSLYLPGSIFIMLGIIVIFFPMLLVALFSAGLIVVGITSIVAAGRLREWRRHPHWTKTWESVDPAVEGRLNRMYAFRLW